MKSFLGAAATAAALALALALPVLARMHNAPPWAPADPARSLGIPGVLPATQSVRMNKSGIVTALGPNLKVTLVKADHSSKYVCENATADKDELHVGGGQFVMNRLMRRWSPRSSSSPRP